ncbi:phospholipase D-like domain-containing protein [Larsenimonas salina]|uniref:phospholipase D-like domain-containing protein n=1 Tax=Larsenimonas salina TaxID=1295565 RepID=UPI0020747C33|nr:phospholipase D-like domain-containing protein [Larsenimonas salina]MCM5703951.1 phospholipase D-like domain-containing protein [Larsenimonas salina]
MRAQWREGNSFTLLPDSDQFLPALFKEMDNAETSLLLELYMFEDSELGERFIKAMENACQRGVKVWLMIDACGSWNLSRKSRKRLIDAGVEFREFNPLTLRHLGKFISRDHRKLMIVDGKVAFTGGFGASDFFLDSWFEVAVRIEGPCVNDWISLYRRVWQSRLSRGPGQPSIDRSVLGASAEKADEPAGEMDGRAIWGQGYRFQQIRKSLQDQVDRAKNQVWICTPYFVPTRSLRRKMIAAARRGVDVRLLLPGKNHDHPGVYYAGQRYYTRLLKAGVRIMEFQPRFTHAKFSLCDDWCTVGSCNFDHWSLQWNLEANQEIHHPEFAKELTELFERNFAQSEEVIAEQWFKRSWWQRGREYVYGHINGMMTRLR